MMMMVDRCGGGRKWEANKHPHGLFVLTGRGSVSNTWVVMGYNHHHISMYIPIPMHVCFDC